MLGVLYKAVYYAWTAWNRNWRDEFFGDELIDQKSDLLCASDGEGGNQQDASFLYDLINQFFKDRERILGGIVRDRVHVAREDRIPGIAQERAGLTSARRAVVPVVGILSEGIGDSEADHNQGEIFVVD